MSKKLNHEAMLRLETFITDLGAVGVANMQCCFSQLQTLYVREVTNEGVPENKDDIEIGLKDMNYIFQLLINGLNSKI